MRKQLISIIYLLFCFGLIAQTPDTTAVYEKIFLRLDWKSIYYTNYFRGSNFVRKIELGYKINKRITVGADIFWGWRFGKNFGEEIGGYSTYQRTKPILKSVDNKPYSFDEWFNDRVLDWGPGYALNYKYQGYSVYLEYQLDKQGIGKILWNRILHCNVSVGSSYLKGESAGKFLYMYKEPIGITYVPSSSDYNYYYVYEKRKYADLTLNLMLRLYVEPKKKDYILPGFSLYYVYSPNQAASGIKNFGWLWDIRIILWKKTNT